MSPLRGGGKALPCGSLPVSHVRRDYLSLISSLPDTDSHALFGLPANIEQSLQRTISSKVCVGCNHDGVYINDNTMPIKKSLSGWDLQHSAL